MMNFIPEYYKRRIKINVTWFIVVFIKYQSKPAIIWTNVGIVFLLWGDPSVFSILQDYMVSSFWVFRA